MKIYCMITYCGFDEAMIFFVSVSDNQSLRDPDSLCAEHEGSMLMLKAEMM